VMGVRPSPAGARAPPRPGIGLGEKPVMWVGVGRQPWGIGFGFSEGEVVLGLATRSPLW